MIMLFIFSGELLAQNPACIPVVTIRESQNDICTGTVVTFHATVANDGTNGVYKWKKNNVNANVNNNADYTSGIWTLAHMFISSKGLCKTKR